MPPHLINHTHTADGKKETIDLLITGSNKESWTRSFSDDRGSLSQGKLPDVKCTCTIEFIHQHHIPKDRYVTCA